MLFVRWREVVFVEEEKCDDENLFHSRKNEGKQRKVLRERTYADAVRCGKEKINIV